MRQEFLYICPNSNPPPSRMGRPRLRAFAASSMESAKAGAAPSEAATPAAAIERRAGGTNADDHKLHTAKTATKTRQAESMFPFAIALLSKTTGRREVLR